MEIKVLILCVAIVLASAKGKSPEKIRREECEKVEVCKFDTTENCAMRCMSEACYLKVYGGYELEYGEIQKDKAKSFSDCFRFEEKERKNEKYNKT